MTNIADEPGRETKTQASAETDQPSRKTRELLLAQPKPKPKPKTKPKAKTKIIPIAKANIDYTKQASNEPRLKVAEAGTMMIMHKGAISFLIHEILNSGTITIEQIAGFCKLSVAMTRRLLSGSRIKPHVEVLRRLFSLYIKHVLKYKL